MTIHDIVAIANLSLVLDLRPQCLKDVEERQMESNGRIEPIRYCNFLFLLTRLVQPLNIIELGPSTEHQLPTSPTATRVLTYSPSTCRNLKQTSFLVAIRQIFIVSKTIRFLVLRPYSHRLRRTSYSSIRNIPMPILVRNMAYTRI